MLIDGRSSEAVDVRRGQRRRCRVCNDEWAGTKLSALLFKWVRNHQAGAVPRNARPGWRCGYRRESRRSRIVHDDAHILALAALVAQAAAR